MDDNDDCMNDNDNTGPRKILKKHASTKAKNEEKLMNLAYEYLSKKKDEYTYWALVCAADLRKMDRPQQIYAEKAIAEILMKGQLRQLHRNSVKINEFMHNIHYSQSPVLISANSTPSTTYVNQYPVHISANSTTLTSYVNQSPVHNISAFTITNIC